MIGKTISHYRILEHLGEGGVGVVYKAYDTHLDRIVGLKLLPPHQGVEPDARARFIQEAKAASTLDHTNICHIHDIDETEDGSLFIAMAFYEGESLKKKIENGSLPVEEALDYVIQMVRGLVEAHKKGMVHRDLKPGNVMITDEGVVKIVDFGLVKMDGISLTKTGTTLGTAMYMSPEQVSGEKVDHRTDAWSLGVMTYEMLTGRQPFRADYEQAVMYRLLNQEPESIREFRSDVPESLMSAVSKLMQKEAEERYADMDALLVDLRAIQTQVASEAARSVETPQPSIAVLPFVNMSPERDQEYFCDGMAVEIINALSQIRNLRVVARTSAFSFKGQNVDVREIGRKLNVKSLLEGSVRKVGSHLKITAQLVNVADGSFLWSQRYDRQLEDVFEIQEEISMAIVERLKVELLGEQQEGLVHQPTENIEAYTLYLKGLYFGNKWSPVEMKKAVSCYQQAIKLDRDFSRAYVELAVATRGMTHAGSRGVVARDEIYPQTQAMVAKAHSLDDQFAEAHVALSLFRAVFEWDWPRAEKAFLRALDLNPDDTNVYFNYSCCLQKDDRLEESHVAACHTEPMKSTSSNCKGCTASACGRSDSDEQANDRCIEIVEMEPRHYVAHLFLGIVYKRQGENEQAHACYQRVLDLIGHEPIIVVTLAGISALLGKTDEVLQNLKELKALSEKQYVSPSYFAWVYYFLHEQEEALTCLEQAYEKRDTTLIHFLLSPRPAAPDKIVAWYDAFYSHPRVDTLKQKVGLA